jgi:hypothetical protein
MVGAFGLRGFMERIEVALLVGSAFFPLFELYYWWKQNHI